MDGYLFIYLFIYLFATQPRPIFQILIICQFICKRLSQYIQLTPNLCVLLRYVHVITGRQGLSVESALGLVYVEWWLYDDIDDNVADEDE